MIAQNKKKNKQKGEIVNCIEIKRKTRKKGEHFDVMRDRKNGHH